jgi:hypothetical protein
MPTPVEMAVVFHRIRDAVLLEATRPSPDDAKSHQDNQATFRRELQEVCKDAQFDADISAEKLWMHVWEKVRYAGFQAAFVTNFDIPSLTPVFSDFSSLAGPEWQFDPNGTSHGVAVTDFLYGTGRFAGLQYNRNKRKLRTILNAAALFQAFPSGMRPLEAFFGPQALESSDEAFWCSHQRAAEQIGFATALHVMMDIGLNCVKPDIWMVRLMCLLGWIDAVLAPNAAEVQIRGCYLRPNTARCVIDRARAISKEIIAWNPSAPLREFDYVMVKYGQDPGDAGIVRSLHRDWLPIQQIMEWNPQENGGD